VKQENVMHKKLLFWGYILSIGMVLCSVYGGSLYASTINVPGDYSTIRDALSAAGEGDIIIVAPGTYAENIEFQGKNVTLRSQDPENPDIVSRTILNLSDKHSIHFSGEEGPSCRVAGFTIQGIILGNYAKPTIEHNRIEYPGSMGMENLIRMVNGRIANNEIINITMTSSISKIFSDCNGIIENNNISGNIFTGNGSLFSNCNGLIRNNIIEFNFIAGSGSPLYNCKARIENNIIRHNDTLTRGGAAYGCTFLRNNIIYGNRAYQGGALAYCSGVIENNVIYGNDAQHIGGGLIHVSGSVRNNIVWGNTSFYMSSQSDFSSGLTYNCIEGWSEDDTNITDDPGFIDPENGDFHLMPDSPCIDAGDPTDDYNMTFNDYLLPPGQGTKRNDMGAYGGQHNHGWTGYHEAMLGVITPHRDIWGAPNYGFAPFGKPYRKGWPGFSYRPQEMIYPLKGDPDGDGDDDIVR